MIAQVLQGALKKRRNLYKNACVSMGRPISGAPPYKTPAFCTSNHDFGAIYTENCSFQTHNSLKN